MCGIAGILNFNDKPVLAEELRKILNKLAHRGEGHPHIALGSKNIPAHSQISTQVEIGLGHRRLSIIDLNQSAAQPMFYTDNGLCLTYNGEIYNYLELRRILQQKSYQFTTHSDTEVLLAAYRHWGKECVHYLNGMFAFAIWDEPAQHLFCARDPLGIKPFYYHLTDKSFSFSSESYSLAHLSQHTLNEDAVFSYLFSMYVLTRESIFKDIHKLAPGHTLLIQPDGHFSIEKFWDINQFSMNTVNDSHVEILSNLLQKAVKQQLHSDVPVGGFLSGGVDSGLITAFAAPHVSKFYTYSVAYDGMPENELCDARQIAERYATIHKEITITSADAMLNLDRALAHLSEPIADPAMVATYMLAEMAAQDGVKVLLNGTGGDEVFAGYTRYTGQLSFKRKAFLSSPPFIKSLLGYLPIASKIKSRLQHVSIDMIFSTGGSYTLAQQLAKNKKYLAQLLKKIAATFTSPGLINLPLLYQQMLFDIYAYLPEELLFLLDQMTMAHTIEGRAPLLDIDVIKFSFNLAANDHISQGQTKSLLKKIAAPYLGVEHVHRKKQGFAGPTNAWIKNHYEHFISVIAALPQVPYFEKFNIDKFKKSARENDIFILYCFAKWYEKIKR